MLHCFQDDLRYFPRRFAGTRQPFARDVVRTVRARNITKNCLSRVLSCFCLPCLSDNSETVTPASSKLAYPRPASITNQRFDRLGKMIAFASSMHHISTSQS